MIFSAVEHPSLTAQEDFLRDRGFKLHYIPVSRKGRLDEESFDKALSDSTLLVSVMLANNETGVIYPVKALGSKKPKQGGLFSQ